jgi:hypothetical protein
MMRSIFCVLIIIIGVTSKISRFYSVTCFSATTGISTASRRVRAARQNGNVQNNNGVKTTIRTSSSSSLSSSSSSSLLRGSNTHDADNNQKKPTVGIIGGGIAGLSCARHLQYAYDVTVVS